MQYLVELGRRYAHDCGTLVDHTFFKHVHSHLQGSDAGALAYTALEHPEFAFLNGKLNVLHIVEVVFEFEADSIKFCINLGHCLLEALQMLVMVGLGSLVQRVGGTDTGNDIFALGVDEPLTIELIVAGSRVAAESHTGCGSIAHVSENHTLDVYSGAPVIGNLLDSTVSDGTLSVPALEHSADGAPKLSLGGIGEFHSEDFLDFCLELVAKIFKLFCGNVGIGLITLGILEFLHHAVELLADTLSVFGLDAFGLLHDDIGVHHDQASVCVIHETGIASLLDHTGKSCGAKADIEDGIHHTGH